MGVLCVPAGIRGAPLTPDMYVVVEESWTRGSDTETIMSNYKALSMCVNASINIVVR